MAEARAAAKMGALSEPFNGLAGHMQGPNLKHE
jgi:hypothetical protein